MKDDTTDKLAGVCVGCIAAAVLSLAINAYLFPARANVLWALLFSLIAVVSVPGIWKKKKWGALGALAIILMCIADFRIVVSQFHSGGWHMVLRSVAAAAPVFVLAIALAITVFPKRRHED